MPKELLETSMETTTARRDEVCLTTRIIDAVATAADADPLELEPPLYRVVDPEAVTRAVETGTATKVTFEYNGYAVAVDSDGAVSVADDGSEL